MIPILDEIYFSQFIEFHRRQINLGIMRLVDADPAIFRAYLGRQESPVKIVITPHTANNFLNWHLHKAQVMLTSNRNLLANFIVAQ